MYFHVYLIYRFTRTFTDHSSVITRCWGFELQKRKIKPQKPANPCDTRLCSCIFFVNTLQKSIESRSFRCFFYCKNCVHARRYMPIPTITTRSTSVMTVATSKCLLESASAPSRPAPERRIFFRARHSVLPLARREVSRMIQYVITSRSGKKARPSSNVSLRRSASGSGREITSKYASR